MTMADLVDRALDSLAVDGDDSTTKWVSSFFGAFFIQIVNICIKALQTWKNFELAETKITEINETKITKITC